MRVNVDVRLSGNCGHHAEAVFDKADHYTTYLPHDQNQDVLSCFQALSQPMARTDPVMLSRTTISNRAISFTGSALQTTFLFMHAIVTKSTL
jgi:hypothetical protein